ncbi:3-isopropylmalate dehydratase large subunit [Carboxydothermus hydrogenoformans]|uniref:3-isopropylmalate dehydratase large subunit n=1 Tax=Carboxydothermus hydrogenoformans (strain ATCC BAA-161 / DSM 6008 / Z-2901) TaxID=246194 RepID=Q3AEQ4_CARHZ|nr:3-isopropylmalate dehydratase, large subunit [Carboxydothermus hydrogenoformans Z-2901]
MGMTMTEKILAYHAGKELVEPGELISCKVDAVLANDITGPVAISEFKKIGVDSVFDRDRVYLVPDHFTPNKDIKSAEQAKILRDFAKEQNLTYYFEVGKMGIEHVLLPEEGLVLPGEVIIGADSHTCTYGGLGAFATGVGSTDLAAAMALGETWFKVPESIKFYLYGEKLLPYVSAKDIILFIIGQIGVDGALYKAMEFAGSALKLISVEGRLTMANMAIEAGAKNGIFPVDELTLEYVKGRAKREFKVFASDPDARYEAVYEINVEEIEPQVALPHLPENAVPVKEVSGKDIDQVVIGSCTNGRIEDLRVAAAILKGKKVKDYVRCIIIPGSQSVYRQALKEGLIDIFLEAGAAVSTPTCGPCLGGHMGILAKGERAVATTNRNFVGRMGHVESEVYLAGPAVAAASAIAGKIVHPEEVR